jgi:acyl-[acyl carrier protein]--UDP-N-acetylglucosamine O-acyltransferase
LVDGAAHLKDTLLVDGDATIAGASTLKGAAHLENTLMVDAAATMGSTLTVANATTLNSGVTVNGASTLNGVMNVSGAASVGGALNVTGVATMNSAFDVKGASHLESSLMVDGSSTFGAAVDVVGASHLKNTLLVDGAATLASSLAVAAAANLASTLDVTGASHLKNTLLVDAATTLGSSLAVTGAANLSNKLDVTGASHLKSTLLVDGAATMSDSLAVTAAASIGGSLDVDGSATLHNSLDVTGAANLASTLDVTGASHLKSTLLVDAAANLGAALDVTGAAHLKNTLLVDAAATLGSSLAVAGAASIAGALTVTGASDLKGAAHLENTLLVDGAANLGAALDVTGAAHLKSTLLVDAATTLGSSLTVSGPATVNGASTLKGAAHLENTLLVDGAAFMANSLSVTGAASMSSTLNVVGSATFQENVVVNGNLTVLGNQTAIDTVSLKVKDSAILLADGNAADAIPVGVQMQYQPSGASAVKYAGMKRKPNTGEFVFFKDADEQFDQVVVPPVPAPVSGAWIEWDVTGSAAIKSYLPVWPGQIQQATAVFKDWTLIGSNDGSSWHFIDSQTDYSAPAVYGSVTQPFNLNNTSLFTIETPRSYSKIRFIISKIDKEVKDRHAVGDPVYGVALSQLALKDANGNFIDAHFTGAVSSDFSKNINMSYQSTIDYNGSTIMSNSFNESRDNNILFMVKMMDDNLIDVFAGANHAYSGSISTTLSAFVASDIYATLMADSFNSASDARLKKDIVPVECALDKIDQIRGVYYNWIDEAQPRERQVGVIAQEIQSVYPELVKEGGNGYLSVDYPKLTAVLIQSIKELKAMVIALKQ